MLPCTKLFNQLLEQYSFSVANRCIASVNPATQAELIDFINHIDSPSTEAVDNRANPEPLEEIASLWQEVLNEPVNWHSVHTQWLVGVTRQRTKRHERYLAYLQEIIQITEQRIDQIKAEPFNKASQLNRLPWYEQRLDKYQQYLQMAQQVYQTSLEQLHYLQSL